MGIPGKSFIKTLVPTADSIGETLVEQARKKALKKGTGQLTEELMQSAVAYADMIKLENGKIFKHRTNFVEAAKGINSSNLDQSMEKMGGILRKAKYSDEQVSKVIAQARESAENSIESLEEAARGVNRSNVAGFYMNGPDGEPTILGALNYVGANANAYFNPGDKMISRNRKFGAAGAYVAGTAGMRYLQGGTLTKDEYGESNIVGVPFI